MVAAKDEDVDKRESCRNWLGVSNSRPRSRLGGVCPYAEVLPRRSLSLNSPEDEQQDAHADDGAVNALKVDPKVHVALQTGGAKDEESHDSTQMDEQPDADEDDPLWQLGRARSLDDLGEDKRSNRNRKPVEIALAGVSVEKFYCQGASYQATGERAQDQA